MEVPVNIVIFLISLTSMVSALVVPEELPSLLSIVYSNIPPIKKGTDSRVGFGFSLGNHADFQVLFELGPQSNTNPIGAPYPSSTGSKRHSEKPAKGSQSQQKNKVTTTQGDKYLTEWSQNMKLNKPYQPLPIPEDAPLKTQQKDGAINAELVNTDGEVQLKQPTPDLPKSALNMLKQLYRQAPSNEEVKEEVKKVRGPERLSFFNVNESKTNDAKKRQVTKDLSDVSLDDE